MVELHVAVIYMKFVFMKKVPTFNAVGAKTMRMGHTIMGSDLGNYMLGVTFQNMAAIESTYVGLANDTAYEKIILVIEIDIRSIIKIPGIL